MQGDMLSPPDWHAELKPFLPIETAHALPIHEPAFPPQEDPDPQIAKPGTGMCQIPNPEA